MIRLPALAALLLPTATLAAAQPPPGSVKETAPDAASASPAPKRKRLKLLVVPIRYASPPSDDPLARDAYIATLPKVGQARQAAMMKQVADWWSAQTYGVVKVDVTVTPLIEAGKPAGCNWQQMLGDGTSGAKTAGFDVRDYGRLMIVTTYSCWQGHWITAGPYMFSWNIYPDASGKAAHELGHALGLEHSAGLDGSVYSNNNSQMGVIYPTLTRLNAFDKHKLGALTPRPCAAATLGSLDAVPDAIRCNDVWIEYRGDTREALVHRAVYVPSSFGDADNQLQARLAAGQSWTDGVALTVRHEGNGRILVRTP